MSETDRVKWDERYRAGAYAGRDYPTPLLVEWESRLPRGRALDVACGAGRNSHFLASRGWRVDAIDISPVGLERAAAIAAERSLDIHWIAADLEEETEALPDGPYALVVLVRYVNRKLFPHLFERLGPGGVLICEQHLESSDEVIGPRNPAFRFRRGELRREVLQAAGSDAETLYYKERTAADPDGRQAALAQAVVRTGASAAWR